MSFNDEIKISVIIPTFNREHTLKRCLESVFTQTEPVNEIIVIDDGSTDDTQDLLKKLKSSCPSDIQFMVIEQQNSGVSAARNSGIKVAKYPWVALLDSDDRWLANKIAAQKDLLKIFPSLKVIHGEEIWIRNGVRVNQMKKHQKFGGWIYQKCLPLCAMSPSSILIHNLVFEKVGLFKESYPVCEDYDLWLKITHFFETGFVPEPIIEKYGGHEDQLSRSTHSMDRYRIESMMDCLETLDLEESDKYATIHEISKKSKVLIQGYLKRGKTQEANHIKSLLHKTGIDPSLPLNT